MAAASGTCFSERRERSWRCGETGDGEREMDEALYREIEQLQEMRMEELRQRYREVFGEESRTKHKQHLVRRIAWRLQVLAQGDLSERARQRALAIANDADLKSAGPARIGLPQGAHCPASASVRLKDRRLPVIGTVTEPHLSRSDGCGEGAAGRLRVPGPALSFAERHRPRGDRNTLERAPVLRPDQTRKGEQACCPLIPLPPAPGAVRHLYPQVHRGRARAGV